MEGLLLLHKELSEVQLSGEQLVRVVIDSLEVFKEVVDGLVLICSIITEAASNVSCGLPSSTALDICDLKLLGRVVVVVYLELVLYSGQPVSELRVDSICQDRRVCQLSRFLCRRRLWYSLAAVLVLVLAERAQ